MKQNNKIIKYNIYLLFILLPIIDCLRRTSIKDINILGFSLIELIYILLIGSTFLLTIINIKNKKELIPLIIYTIILFIYIFFHDLNILKFNQSIYPKSNINIITETYYTLRVYYMPILLLFILIKNKNIFNLDFYKKISKILICIISLSIIVLNIFKLSYATYSATNDEYVKYNIFDYYKSNEEPKLLSTRGWFDSSNEISAILLMLFPINIYMLYKENKKYNYFLYIAQFLAMIILGTRVSSLGAIILTITTILINIISKIIKQRDINYNLIISGIICTLFFLVAPIGIHLLEYEAPNYNIQDEYNEELIKLTTDEEIVKYIEDNLYYFRINEAFIELYPTENDTLFWKQAALRDRNLNNDSRVMKTTIIKRIKERNNNKLDTALGMGYTINFMDLERDYVYQYYIYGILGIILIIPQLIIFIKIGIHYLINIKHIDLIKTLLICMAPALGLLVAYYSGHVFGWISPSYILILAVSLMYNTYKENTFKI